MLDESSSRDETEALLGSSRSPECFSCCWQPAPPKPLGAWLTLGAPVGERKASSRIVQRHSVDENLEPPPRATAKRKFTLGHVAEGEQARRDEFMTVVAGHRNKTKILRYDAKALISGGGINTLLHFGTVVRGGEEAKTLVRGIGVMALITLGSFLAAVVAVAGDLSELKELDMAAMGRLMNQLNFVTVFILGQYIVICLGRWWAIRTLALQQVYDAFADLCTLLAMELRGPRWAQVREQVQKFGFASLELVGMAARDETDLSHLVADGLLNNREADFLLSRSTLWERPMACWAWIMRIVADAVEYEVSAHAAHGRVTTQCLAAIKGITTITNYMETQLPFAYVHLVMLLVNVQNVVLSLKTGIGMARAMASGNFVMMLTQGLGCMVVCFLYQSLMQISCLVLDPFGDSPAGMPIKAQFGYLSASISTVNEAQPSCLVVAEDGSLHMPLPQAESEAGTMSMESESSRQASIFSESVEPEVSEGSARPPR